MNAELNIHILPPLITFLSSFALGLFILLKNKKSLINRSFFALAFCVCYWQLLLIIVYTRLDPSSALFWVRIMYYGIVFITPSTYLFIVSLLHFKKRGLVYLFYAFAFIFTFIAWSKYFVIGVEKLYWGYTAIAGVIHPIFLILWSIPPPLALLHLYKKYKEAASPYDKRRIRHFLITLPIAYLGAVDYLPNYGIAIYPFGFIPVMFFIISTAYAIVRYRLLDIEIIVKKLTLVSLAFILSVSLIYTGTFYLQPHLSKFIGKNWLLFPVFISFLVSFGLFQFINFVKHIEEDELSKKFAYRRLLKKEAERISAATNIKEMLSYTTRDLSSWVKLDYVGIFIWNTHNEKFVLARSLTRTKKRKKIPLGLTLTQNNSLVIELLKKRKPLVYSEMEYYLKAKAIPDEEREFLFMVCAEMQRLGVEISIPSFCEDKLLAIINLGHKLNSNEIITDEDLETFSSLSNHIARAIYGFILKEEKIKLIVGSYNILISVIEAKDKYTRGHTDRVAHYSALIGKSLEKQLNPFHNALSNLNWAAQLHDVGKIGIADAILLKSDSLTEKEMSEVKQHPINGIRIVNPVREWLGEDICAGILHHHENYDGSGYPSHQKGEDIHMFARIIRVADVFDAMTTDRPYRPAYSKEEVIEKLKEYKGIYFDSQIVGVIEQLYDEGQI